MGELPDISLLLGMLNRHADDATLVVELNENIVIQVPGIDDSPAAEAKQRRWQPASTRTVTRRWSSGRIR